MGVMMSKNKQDQNLNPTTLDKFIRKIIRIFDWIAEGHTAGVLCKG
jgi:hypothetical protein